MMAEAGADNFNITKTQSAFERGIKRDGAIASGSSALGTAAGTIPGEDR
jgi:hypothetical protein